MILLNSINNTIEVIMKALANNIEIEYDTFGDPSGKPLLLIMGLGAQMISWLPELCELFVEKGFYVIRFDNRDVGLTSKFGHLGAPKVMEAITKAQNKEKVTAPYSLEDMAADAIGLLDYLNIEKAHICGASMGSMIAQVIAINYPSRVLTLIPIMGSTGNPDLPQATPQAMQALVVPMPTKREKYIKESVKRGRILYGEGFPYSEELREKLAAEAYDRCFYPEGFSRQLVAIMANGDRSENLNSLDVPTLVIHGKDDPLVPVEGGIAISENIPGAELLLIDGMGHSLPPETWPQIVDAINKNAEKA